MSPQMAARCRILQLWTEAFFPKWMRNSRRGLRLWALIVQAHSGMQVKSITYMYIPCMYVDEQCTHIVHTCYIHAYTSTCTWYRHVYICIYLLKKKTGDRKEAAQKERLQRGAETRRRRKADWAWWDMKCGCEQSICQYVESLYTVYTCLYLFIRC